MFCFGTACAQTPKLALQLKPMFDDNGKMLETVTASASHAEGLRMPRTRSGETTLRLDSVVGFDTDGQKQTLQYFTYNEGGALLHRTNSYYNSLSDGWDAAEEYDYKYSTEGYLLEETMTASGWGTRSEYGYDDQGQRIMQAAYSLDADGMTWVPQQKIESEYDGQGNIVAETLSFWNGDTWQRDSRNAATWDEKGRQTGYESYIWNGTDWTGSGKQETVYYDGPAPEVSGDFGTNRVSYLSRSEWQDGAWRMTWFFTNTYDDEGYVIGQSQNHWNGSNFGGDNGNLMTFRNEITYDEHHSEVSATTYRCVNDSTLWIQLGVVETEWEYDEEGNREGLAVNYVYSYSEDFATRTDTVIGEQKYYGYNADGQQTWLLEQTPDAEGRMKSDYEEKYRFDSNGAQTYTASWYFDGDGQRLPNLEQTRTYDEQGNQISMLSRSGSGEAVTPPAAPGAAYDPADDEGWTNLTRFDYAYEGSTRIENLGYRWEGGAWLPNMGESVEYDFAYPLETLVVPSAYADPYKIEVIYTLNGDGGDGWLTTEQRYYWAEHSATGIAEASRAAFAVTFEDNKLLVEGCADVANYVYSASGMLVYTGHSSSEDLSHLAPGLYVAVSVSGQERIVTKLTID